MVDVIDAIGRVRWHCPRCTARAAGHCWQCGKRRENQRPAAAYCRDCAKKRNKQAQRASHSSPQQIERRRLYDKQRNKRPGYREYNTAHKREWMQRHPEKFAEYAEKARERWRERRADPIWWEQQKARQRERYAKRQAQARGESS